MSSKHPVSRSKHSTVSTIYLGHSIYVQTRSKLTIFRILTVKLFRFSARCTALNYVDRIVEHFMKSSFIQRSLEIFGIFVPYGWTLGPRGKYFIFVVPTFNPQTFFIQMPRKKRAHTMENRFRRISIVSRKKNKIFRRMFVMGRYASLGPSNCQRFKRRRERTITFSCGCQCRRSETRRPPISYTHAVLCSRWHF